MPGVTLPAVYKNDTTRRLVEIGLRAKTPNGSSFLDRRLLDRSSDSLDVWVGSGHGLGGDRDRQAPILRLGKPQCFLQRLPVYCGSCRAAEIIRVEPRARSIASRPSLLIHARSRSILRLLCCSRFWNDCLRHGRGWHFRLVFRVRAFSLNRFAIERIDHFASPRLPYRRTIIKSVIVLCKCRRRQKDYCGCPSVHFSLPK